MPEHFNPYHQWLGLGYLTSPAAPHQLLGVPRGETDVATIQRAAEQARSRVLTHSPGPRVSEWTQLLAEIEAAKNSLIADATARNQTQTQPGAVPVRSGGLHRPAPRPKAAATGIPVAAPVPSSTAAPYTAGRHAKYKDKARRAKRSSSLVLLSWMAGALMLVAAVLLPLMVALRIRDHLRNRSARVHVAPLSADAPSPGPTPAVETLPKQPRTVRPGTSSEPIGAPVEPRDEMSEVVEPARQDLPAPVEPTEILPRFGQDAIGNQLPPSPQQIQEISQALAAARNDLERDRFQEALTRLSAVQNLPMSNEDLQRHQRLQLLVQYASHFHNELSKSLGALQGGDDIPVGTNKVVGVVEADTDRITVRVEGASRTYQREALPAGLAVAIVDLRLDDSDPTSLVLKAAYLASRHDVRDDQLQRARDWFRQAKQQGADIGDLEKVLDDTYGPPPYQGGSGESF